MELFCVVSLPCLLLLSLSVLFPALVLLQNWDDHAHLSFVYSHLGDLLELLVEPGQLSSSGQAIRSSQVGEMSPHVVHRQQTWNKEKGFVFGVMTIIIMHRSIKCRSRKCES